MDRNSQANEFTGVAGFLCGLDDEPPISGPAAAAAFLQHGLDNDPAFQFGRPPGLQPTSWQELARAYPPNTRDQRGKACTHGIEKSSTHLQNSVSSQESSQRELEVHCETEENGNKVDQIERFMINLEGELRVPDGFFTKLRQRFHLTPDAPTELTWRFFDDAKKTRNRLQTNEDAQQALERCKAAFRSRQRQKPVHLYVKAQVCQANLLATVHAMTYVHLLDSAEASQRRKQEVERTNCIRDCMRGGDADAQGKAPVSTSQCWPFQR